ASAMGNRNRRRAFLKNAALAGLGGWGLAACSGSTSSSASGSTSSSPTLSAASSVLFSAPPLQRVRMGFVGVGHQGGDHIQNFLGIDGVDIVAICDTYAPNLNNALDAVVRAGRPRPKAYGDRGVRDYERMVGEEDLDLVFTATPWEWHAPVMLAALRAGKHAATEVPMAVSLDELWQLVETAEKAQRHCVMMENCNYDRPEMAILNMVRRGMFGELLHAECGYLHDLRGEKLSDYYVGRWRLQHSIRRNGDLYPTHGVGPVAQWMNINRGNQFDYAVSMASNSRGLNLWAAEHFGPNSAEAVQPYALGDVVTTMVKTKAGQTIVITHNTDSPRPYSRNILLQGTKGLMRKYPNSLISLEGVSNGGWQDFGTYQQPHDHPLWQALDQRAAGGGHGGMDWIEDYRLIQCLR